MPTITIIVNTRATEIRLPDLDKLQTSGSLFSPAGIEIIESFMEYLKTERGVLVSRLACGEALLSLGNLADNICLRLWGRNISDGTPLPILVTTEEVQGAISGTLAQLIQVIARHMRHTLQDIPSSEAVTVILAGEFRQLQGLDTRLATAIGVAVTVET